MAWRAAESIVSPAYKGKGTTHPVMIKQMTVARKFLIVIMPPVFNELGRRLFVDHGTREIPPINRISDVQGGRKELLVLVKFDVEQPPRLLSLDQTVPVPSCLIPTGAYAKKRTKQPIFS